MTASVIIILTENGTVRYGIVDKIGLPTVFYQKVLLDHLLNDLDVKLISADF